MAFQNPTDAYTNSDVAAMIPEVWSPIVNEPNFPKAVLSNFVTDLSEFMSEGGDIVHVPDIYSNTFTVQTQSTQGNAVTDESVAQVDTTLTVNTHKYVAFLVGDLTMKQLARSYNLNSKYAREVKNLLTQALEDSLFALWSSLSTNTVGDTTTVLTDSDLRESVEKLDSLDYDISETGFFVHPFVFWTQIAGISKFYQHNIALTDFIRTGNFGQADRSRGLRGILYDQPIYVSSRVVSGLQTYRNLFLHPSCFGFAIQTEMGSGGSLPAPSTEGGGFSQNMGGPNRIRIQADYLLQNLGTLVVGDIIYGVAVLREEAGVLVNANNSATTS